MNRIKFEQILPNLSAMVKFVGGPWDGFKLRWCDGPCPEYVEVEDKKIEAQQTHKYKRHVITDKTQTTHVQYLYVEPVLKTET